MNAGRVDVMTTDAGARVRKAHARDLAANVVQNLHRLIKLAQMHAIDNQAVRRQIDATVEALREYQLKAGESVVLFFARGVVFFGGEPLKASRAVYDAALELSSILERCGGSELAFAPDVNAADIRGFTTAVVNVLRGRRFADHDLPRVRVRQVSDAALLRGLDVEHLDPEQRIVRTYASAVVILRRFFDDLAKGQLVLPKRIKRIAQNLVDLSEGKTPAFLGVTAVRNANHDDAGRAVNSAILAVSMGRQVTNDRVTLTRIAMAAMLHDVGRPRAIRAEKLDTDDGGALMAHLSEQAELSLPAGTAAMLTALGRVNEPSIVRTVVAYEAVWLRKARRLGPVHRGLRPPTLHARIVALARAYNELLTPSPGEPIRTPTDALLQLEEEASSAALSSGKISGDNVDRTMLRLLMGALGVLPPGTLVELSSGEIAVIIDVDGGAARPTVRIVLDSSGGMPDHALEFRLGGDDRTIVKVVGTDPSFVARRSSEPVSSPPTSTPSVQSFVTSSGVRAAPQTETERAPPPIESRPPTPPPPARRAPALSRLVTEPPVSPRVTHAPIEDERTLVTRSPFEDSQEEEAATVARNSPLPAPPDKRPALSRNFSVVVASEPPPSRPPASTPSGVGSSPYGRTPDVQGSMARSPLPHLLVHVLSRALTGTMVMKEPSGRDHIVIFDKGAPTKVQLAVEMRRLGEVLVSLGLIDSRIVDPAVAKAKNAGRPLGKQLVIDGVLHSGDVLAALRVQLTDRLAMLTALPPDTTYQFFTGDDVLPNREPVTLDPLAVVMAATRRWRDRSWMDGTLARLGDRPIALHTAANLSRFVLNDDESAAIEWATQGGLTFAQLLAEGIAPEPTVRALIYTLTITKHLDLGVEQWPLAIPKEVSIRPDRTSAPPSSDRSGQYEDRGSFPPPSGAYATNAPVSEQPVILRNSYEALHQSTPVPPSAKTRAAPEPIDVRIVDRDPSDDRPPPSSPRPPPISDRGAPPPANPEMEARRRTILEKFESLGESTHYSILGLEPGATLSEIQNAFLAGAKKYHPDRLAPELTDIREQTAKVFGAMSDAHRTLIDTNKRSAYDARLTSGRSVADEAGEVERVLEASTNFQKAEVMLKRNDNAAAERYAQLAVEGDPTQGEYLALYGWLYSMKGEKDSLVKGLELLDRALGLDKDSDRALYYRGTVFKRLGRNEAAIKDFRAAADLNPKNVDAAREVRLYNMRAAGGPGGKNKPEEKEGLFGGLFKKKKK